MRHFGHSSLGRAAAFLIAAALVLTSAGAAGMKAEAKGADGETVIVLDPGHSAVSGDLGAQYPPYNEGQMTLELAQYIAGELSQYDNVKVYLTRKDGSDPTLAQRVETAHQLGADFLCCLHYNAYGDGSRNGAEVHVSANPALFPAEAYFAQTELNELENAGLSVRGIKYRIGKNGQDYYGIIRRATAYGMQSVIIEHCYLDGPEDRRFLAQKDAVSKLGHADALALAKHLHLKSSAYGVDFSNYEETSITYPVGPFD